MRQWKLWTIPMVALALVGIGSAPRYIEEVRIGGGYGATGTDLEADGDINTDGNINVQRGYSNATVPFWGLYDTDAGTGLKRAAVRYNAGATDDDSVISFASRGDDDVAVTQLFTADRLGNCEVIGDLTVTGGDAVFGSDTSVRGVVTTWDGSANAPGAWKTASTNGTVYYLWMANDGDLRSSTTLPTSDTDGSGVSIDASSINLRVVDDAGMDGTNGTEADLVYNNADDKAYVCTATGTPGTWAALN